MQIDLLDRGAFTSALVQLLPGEKFVSESGAMFRASSNIDIDVTTRSRSTGGLLSGVKRLFASENFFFSTYTVNDGRPGEVGIAPTHQGELELVDLEDSTAWLCAGGSYLGSTADVNIDTQFQGLKGFFTGESLSFVRLTGSGQFIVSAFGRIVEMRVSDQLIVDTGHVVAFEETLQYEISKAGGSWLHSWLAGEGMVLKFRGSGRILVQSHNPTEFGRMLGPQLPER